MMIIRTKWQGRDLEAPAEFINGTLWIHHEGRTFSVAAENKRKKRRQSGAGAGEGDLEAPMPGKITKLLKTAGDSVKKGEVVLVMEAMKMEYTLKAGADGVIEKILCETGEQVSLGQTLVAFEAKTGA